MLFPYVRVWMNATFPGRYKHQNVSIKIKLNPALKNSRWWWNRISSLADLPGKNISVPRKKHNQQIIFYIYWFIEWICPIDDNWKYDYISAMWALVTWWQSCKLYIGYLQLSTTFIHSRNFVYLLQCIAVDIQTDSFTTCYREI